MQCIYMLLILCMRNYILLVCRILLTTFYITISTGRSKSKKNGRRPEMTFPFLIFTGSLESHDTIYLAADKHIICDFEASLVESALALLATYYVFMYNYPPELAIFFLFAKMHFAYSKLPFSVISLVNYFLEHQSVSAECFALRSV